VRPDALSARRPGRFPSQLSGGTEAARRPDAGVDARTGAAPPRRAARRARSDDPAELRADLEVDRQELGQTVVLVTHDLFEAEFFADRVVRCGMAGSSSRGAAQLVERPADPFVTRFINAQSRPGAPMSTRPVGVLAARSGGGGDRLPAGRRAGRGARRLQEVHRVGRARRESSPRWCAAPARAPRIAPSFGGDPGSLARALRGRSTSTPEYTGTIRATSCRARAGDGSDDALRAALPGWASR